MGGRKNWCFKDQWFVTNMVGRGGAGDLPKGKMYGDFIKEGGGGGVFYIHFVEKGGGFLF